MMRSGRTMNLYRGLLLAGVLLLVIPLSLSLAGAEVPGQDESGGMGQTTCENAFGDGWEYAGYTEAIPPVVNCEGPNGQHGVVEMPPEMQEELGIVVADGEVDG